MKKYLSFLIVFFLIASFVCTEEVKEVKNPEMAPDFTLVDADGNKHSLSDYKDKIVVLEWTNYKCPFVKKHYRIGNMQKLQKKYGKKGVVWLSICSSAKGKQGNFASKEIKKNILSLKATPSAYLIDEDGAVGRAYGAKTTPHMFVISAKGAFLYKGAIDADRGIRFKGDVSKVQNFVAETLDIVLGDKKGNIPGSTKSYGCGVKYNRK